MYSVATNEKKCFLWTMAAAQAAENHGDEWGLTWYLQWGVYTSVPPWTLSQNSLADAEAFLPWSISYINIKIIPISTRIVISHVMKWGILFWVYWKVNGNWDNNLIRIPNWGKAIAEQIVASEEISKSKRAGLWESQSGYQVGKLTVWVRSADQENIIYVKWNRVKNHA